MSHVARRVYNLRKYVDLQSFFFFFFLLLVGACNQKKV